VFHVKHRYAKRLCHLDFDEARGLGKRWQEQSSRRHRRACPGDLDQDGTVPDVGLAETSPAMTKRGVALLR
jgi:hypothetical protein